MLETRRVDPERLDSFMHKLLGDLGSAMSAGLTFIGDRLGLYRAMAEAGPVTAAELAALTDTKERYVREWLLNQAASGYLAYNADTDRYELTPEATVVLVDEDSHVFSAGGFQLIVAMMQAVPRIEQAFRSGEGMAWREHNPHLFEGTERFFRTTYRQHLADTWIGALDGMRQRLEDGARVADVGCGHGASTLIMAHAYPRSEFHGFDNHEASVQRAREAAARAGMDGRLRFEVFPAQRMPLGSYDLICFFDCLHDMGEPLEALRRARQAMARDGAIMLVEPWAGEDVADNLNPVGRIYSAASTLCCTPNAVATGGTALGTMVPERELRDLARSAGFERFRKVVEDPFNRVFEIRL